MLPALIDQRFQLEREVGAGGMGRIWRAQDLETGRPVAIKVMATDAPTAVERFQREAVTLASIRHPGIVDYIAHGLVDGRPYLVMEWLEGVDLARRLRLESTRLSPAELPTLPGRPVGTIDGRVMEGSAASGPEAAGLPAAEVAVMARRLASALGEVHARGVVHRDVKPDNVLLVDGDLTRAKLIDFGVARGLGGGPALTDQGAVIGTPYYMAPEQVRGEEVGPPADVWGLGGVLYEALAGQPAFHASHPLGAMARIVVDEPAPLATLRPDLPIALPGLVHAMLAKDPAARPRSGEPLASAFERILEAIAASGEQGAAPAPRAAGTQSGRHRITGSERRMRSLVFARRAASAPRAGLAQLRERVAALGGGLEPMDAHEQAFLVTAGGSASPRDQATRAAQLALALRRTERDLAIAVVTGRGSDDGQHTPVGEVVDRAVQLLGRAPPGAIELDALTAGLVEGRCLVDAASGAFHLRGLRLHEEARTLLGRPSRWVGRRRELTTLVATYDDCLEHGEPRAALVVGQPGMGKSRLRHELLRALRERGEPLLVLHGQGDSLSAGAPFGVLGPAVRRELVGGGAAGAGSSPALALDAQVAQLRERVAQVMGAEAAARTAPFLGELCGARFDGAAHPALAAARSDPMLLGEQVRAACAAWLAAEAARRPVVLVIEDLHWGDLPSVNAIDHALREVRGRPLLVLATARPEVRDVFPRLWAGRGVVELELHPLPPRACAELVTDALGARATPEVVEQLVARCEGNAFYLEELIRAVAEGGLDQLPDTVIGTVQARLEALDQEARRVLRAAAIFGEEFTAEGVRALLGGGAGAFDVGEWLGDLERRELVHAEPGGRGYRFRHALLRDGAYQMLTEADRQVGHYLAARWLEEAGHRDALTLAGHYERGGDRPAAVRCYRIAVDDALEGNDLAAVIERGERAHAAGAAGEVLGEIRGAQAIAAYWRSDYAAAARFGDGALELLPVGAAAWFRAAGAAVVAAARLGDFEGVDRRFDRAVEAPCAPGAEAAQLQCLCRGTFQLVFNGRFARADEILARIAAIHGAAPAPAVDALTTAQVEHVQGVRAAMVGDVARFLRHLEAAVAAFEQAGDVRNVSLERTTVAWCFAEVGQLERAERLCRENLAHCQALRAPQATTYAKVNLGYILVYRPGARPEAVAVLGEAIEECRAVGNARLEGWARAHRATARLYDGDAAAALEDAEAAVAALAMAPGLQAWALALRARTRVAMAAAAGEPAAAAEAALADARAAMAVLERIGGLLQGESQPSIALAEALAAGGDAAGAAAAWADARRRLVARADRLGDPAWRASFLALPESAQILEAAAALPSGTGEER